MSLWSRITNVLRGDRLNREIDDELQSHIEEAIEQGRDPDEARRAFGPTLLRREESRDIRLVPWLDSLRADAIFGWRQLMKRKAISSVAVLSLALAFGACTATFRLIDAMLLRPLPVAQPEQLYALSHVGTAPDGQTRVFDYYEYPLLRQMRDVMRDQAELIGISHVQLTDLTYGSDQDTERAYLQWVSGWMFDSFGLRPALGRLLTENEDLQPGAHPYAVLSHDYWTRRFGRDPKVIGRALRIGKDLYTIIGVSGAGFTGTHPGTFTDIFLPTMMNSGVTHSTLSWVSIWVKLRPGVAAGPVREKLNAAFRTFRMERVKGFQGWPKQRLNAFINVPLLLEPVGAGVSQSQREYRRPLITLGIVAMLVLLIACANVANLMTAQAAGRRREMALRVSIGAGSWRLLQLALVEGAWLAMLAAAIGGVFAWWSAPLVTGMISSAEDPIRLVLPFDWRVMGFGMTLAFGVTLLFGLAPALRAARVKPAVALKGGEDPSSRYRTMHTLIAAQVAFCFFVLFVTGLLVTTFDRLANQPAGFSSQRILVLDTVSPAAQPFTFWDQVMEHLRAVPGVERVALAGRPLLAGRFRFSSVSIDGAPTAEVPASLLEVSPGWLETMKIALIDGRDFRHGDRFPGVAIVNQAFAKQYFGGQNPVGKSFTRTGERVPVEIVGLVRDARDINMREPILPTAYVPFESIGANGSMGARSGGTFIVRTSSSDPLSLAQTLHREIPRARSEFRVSSARAQAEIMESQMLRERLLARLALFFAAVALLLAGIGLYGVLTYSVVQRRREIGIRMAIGAQAGDIVRRVTASAFSAVVLGAIFGTALGMASVRYIETLLYQVKGTDPGMLMVPSMAIVAAACLAALPAVIRAVHIDPANTLRAE
jgi:predicted permease